MDTLSVILITYNEEKHIGKCLDSIMSVADEIIIVDSFSNDATIDICKHYPTKVIQNKFCDFSSQRNLAMSLASKSYLLFIDADEVLSEELAAEISKFKNEGFEKEVYSINRLTSFCGKWIKHGMWYPDKIQRLIKQGVANWIGEVHEKLNFTIPASKGFIKGHLLHYSYDSVGQLVEKLEKYTSIQSKQMFKENKKATWIKIYINPVWAFFSGYFLKLGFLDGWQGIIIQYSIAFQTKRKYIKLKKLYVSQKGNI
jgi:glycosyltransferase involved in cell wall biosynthesis